MKYLFFILFSWFSVVSLYAQNYEIGQTTITFNDPTRSGGFGSGGGPGRQIQTEIYYPADVAGTDVAISNDSFPVIVFGHGFAMVWSAYQNIWEDIVPNGYIIAFPRTEGGLLPPPSHGDFGDDLAIVETSLQQLNSNVNSLFYQKIKGSSAIIGHSMGGGATFLAAANNNSPTLKAVVGLAPAETNPSAISAAQNVSHNSLILSGSSDGVTPPNTNHIPIYNNLASDCKTFLSILNGSHCYFANSNFNCDFGELTTGTGSLSRNDQQDITAEYLLLWLDFQLKSNCLSWDAFLDSIAVDNRISPQQSCSYSYIQPKADISGPNSFCNGDSIILTTAFSNSYSYTWFLDGSPLPTNQSQLNAFNGGDYQVVAQNQFSCSDTSPTYTLTTIPSYTIFDTALACIGSNFQLPDGSFITQDTFVNYAYSSQNGCDSLYHLQVNFGNAVENNIQATLCYGDTFHLLNHTIFNDTSFSDTLFQSAQFGCDSIINITITNLDKDSVFEIIELCAGENYQLPSGLFVNYEDTFTFTFNNQSNCDSMHTYAINVTPQIQIFDTTITYIGIDTIAVSFISNTLINSFYNINSDITYLYNQNDTFYFYVPFTDGFTIDGELFSNTCSLIFNYAVTSINKDNKLNRITIYPNPSKSYLHLTTPINHFSIIDLSGKVIVDQQQRTSMIDIRFLSQGTYLLKTNLGQSLFNKQ